MHFDADRYFAAGGPANVSPAQREAGNFPKKHERVAGLPIAIENPKGSTRLRQDSGPSKMAADYGQIVGSAKDADKMDVDTYVGPYKDSDRVFVINQQHPHSKRFNEHKVMLGYKDRAHAVHDYVHSFADGQGHKRVQSIVEMGKHEFKDWVKHGRHNVPIKKAEGGEIDLIARKQAEMDPRKALLFGESDQALPPAGLPIGQAVGTKVAAEVAKGLMAGSELTRQAIEEGKSPDYNNPEDVEKVLSAASTGLTGGVAAPVKGAGMVLGAGPIRRGPIKPLTSAPTEAEIAAARADTRVGGDVVNKRLDILVPEKDRVVGGEYIPGAPDGGRWADMPEEFLEKRGLGFHITDEMREAQSSFDQAKANIENMPSDVSKKVRDGAEADFHRAKADLIKSREGADQVLQQLWDDAVSKSSQAAKDAVEKYGVKPKFLSEDWDKAMRTPYRDHLWYELSGEKFHENLPDITPKEHRQLMDIIGATSARAEPGENLERGLSVLSQNMRGVPVDVDLTIPTTVRQSLAREGEAASALPGNKTGHFSDTLTLTGGVPTRFPISVNDVWVGKMFGVPDEVMSSNQSLHEPMAMYFNNIRDLYNERMDTPFKYQSWNFQAPAWVHLRNEVANANSGDAYHQVWDDIISKLKSAGIPGIKGEKITRDALMHPGFADALRRTTPEWRAAPKATVEFGTTQTPTGATAHQLYNEALERGDQKSAGEYLKDLTTAMYASARGKHPWDSLKKAITGDVTNASDITRIMHPSSEAPLDIGGTFEGAVSPNIRIPLKGMSDDDVAAFNAVAGKHLRQDAMAVSHILDANNTANPRNGYIRGHSIFVPTTDSIDPSHIRSFAKELSGHGHDMSYARYPNGYNFDVLPNFSGDVPAGISPQDLKEAYSNSLGIHYSSQPTVVPHEFKSVYTPASEYETIRGQLTQRIQDDFIKQATQSGTDQETAAAIAAGRSLPSSLTGRSKKAWDTFQKRLGHLSDAETAFAALANRIEGANTSFVERAKKRFKKADKAAPKEDKAMGGPVNYAKGGAVGHPSAHIALVSDLRKTAKDHGFQKPAMTHLIKMMGIPNPRASVYAQNVLNDPQLHNKINPVTEKFLITLHGAMKHTAAQKHTGELRRHLRDRVIYGNP